MTFATFEERINDLKTHTDELWDEMTREEQMDHLLPHAANNRALVLGTLNSDEIPFLTEAEWQSYGYLLSLAEWRDALHVQFPDKDDARDPRWLGNAQQDKPDLPSRSIFRITL